MAPTPSKATGGRRDGREAAPAPILVAIGSNLPVEGARSPRESCERAVEALGAAGIRVVARSRWYRSAPVPASDQPDYVNGVVRVETGLAPEGLLAALHRIEAELGRVRTVANAARRIDLDLIAFGSERRAPADGAAGGLVLPHPRLHERAFVLLPLAEVAPGWRHPASGRTVAEMIAALGPGQRCEPLE